MPDTFKLMDIGWIPEDLDTDILHFKIIDNGDGTFSHAFKEQAIGGKSDSAKTDVQQDATVISLLKGNIVLLKELKTVLEEIKSAIESSNGPI